MKKLDNITINLHTSIKISGSKVIYFDPYEVKKKAKDADIIFVTHEHFDHFDPPSIKKIAKKGSILVAPASMKEKALAESGISVDKCVFLTPWEKNEIEGLVVEAIPAYNNGKPFHPEENNWIGYVVEMDETKYFICGDTDVNKDNVTVKCDIALIPIGGKFTMDSKQGAELASRIKPAAAIPTHYGSVVGTLQDGVDFAKSLKALDPEIQVELKIK